MLKQFLLVGLGGGIGSMLRYGTAMALGTKPFPVATFLINVTGSFIIGLVIAFSLKNEAFAGNWKPFLATGICGGFTTFSAFSVENLELLQNGKYIQAIVYIVLSILLGILASWLGYKIING